MESTGLSQLLEIGGPVVAIACFAMWIQYKLVGNHLKTLTKALEENTKAIHRMVENCSKARWGDKP